MSRKQTDDTILTNASAEVLTAWETSVSDKNDLSVNISEEFQRKIAALTEERNRCRENRLLIPATAVLLLFLVLVGLWLNPDSAAAGRVREWIGSLRVEQGIPEVRMAYLPEGLILVGDVQQEEERLLRFAFAETPELIEVTLRVQLQQKSSTPGPASESVTGSTAPGSEIFIEFIDSGKVYSWADPSGRYTLIMQSLLPAEENDKLVQGISLDD